jgi:hypothetical protein
VRTFADSEDLRPEFMDLVAHCGARMVGSFVHTLVLTDVASGWTECIALPVREQALIVEAINAVQAAAVCSAGLDTDNDSAFMKDTLWDLLSATEYCFHNTRATGPGIVDLVATDGRQSDLPRGKNN